MEKIIKLVKSGKFSAVNNLLKKLSEKKGLAEVSRLVNEVDYLERRNGGSKFTALSWAARLGYIDIVKLLVAYGADINQVNHHNQTSADVARFFKNFEIAKFLDNRSFFSGLLTNNVTMNQLSDHLRQVSDLNCAANEFKEFQGHFPTAGKSYMGQLYLGLNYLEGKVITADLPKAYQYLMCAYQQVYGKNNETADTILSHLAELEGKIQDPQFKDMVNAELAKACLIKHPPDEKKSEDYFNKIGDKSKYKSLQEYFLGIGYLKDNLVTNQQRDVVSAIACFKSACELKVSHAETQLLKLTEQKNDIPTRALASIALYQTTNDEKYTQIINKEFGAGWYSYFEGICALTGKRQYQSTRDIIEAANLFKKASEQGVFISNFALFKCYQHYPDRFNLSEQAKMLAELAAKSSESDAVFITNQLKSLKLNAVTDNKSTIDIKQSIDTSMKAANGLLKASGLEKVEIYLDRLSKLKLFATANEQAIIDKFLTNARVQQIQLYTSTINTMLDSHQLMRAEDNLNKLADVLSKQGSGINQDKELAGLRRKLKSQQIKVEYKACENLPISQLKAYLVSENVPKQVAAEKRLGLLAKNANNDAKHVLLSYYEEQAEKNEKQRDRLLLNPSLDNRSIAHFHQLMTIHNLESAVEFGSVKAKVALQKYAYEFDDDLDEKQQITYSRNTHSELSNGQLVSVNLAKNAIAQLDVKANRFEFEKIRNEIKNCSIDMIEPLAFSLFLPKLAKDTALIKISDPGYKNEILEMATFRLIDHLVRNNKIHCTRFTTYLVDKKVQALLQEKKYEALNTRLVELFYKQLAVNGSVTAMSCYAHLLYNDVTRIAEGIYWGFKAFILDGASHLNHKYKIKELAGASGVARFFSSIFGKIQELKRQGIKDTDSIILHALNEQTALEPSVSIIIHSLIDKELVELDQVSTGLTTLDSKIVPAEIPEPSAPPLLQYDLNLLPEGQTPTPAMAFKFFSQSAQPMSCSPVAQQAKVTGELNVKPG